MARGKRGMIDASRALGALTPYTSVEGSVTGRSVQETVLRSLK